MPAISCPLFTVQYRPNSFRMRDVIVVTSQQVVAEVILQVPPDGVNVIGVVLGIVVLHQKCGSLYTIIMRLPALQIPGPGKIEISWRAFGDLCEIRIGD